MFLRNPGRFRYKIKLLKPGTPERDEIGGLKSAAFSEAVTLFSLMVKRAQVKQDFIGEYVTADTRYFVVRDLETVCPDIDTTWRLECGGVVYQINDVLAIDDTAPSWVQITAKAIRGNGGL